MVGEGMRDRRARVSRPGAQAVRACVHAGKRETLACGPIAAKMRIDIRSIESAPQRPY